ncbi:MAG: FecR domain-containing protein, partial [Bacteroidetes bacterium]|nr:FecR domain-containing protein [Bacteroidota bacterium]
MQQEPLHIDWERFIDLLEKPEEERKAILAAMPAEEQALFLQLQQLHNDELLTGALQLNTAQAWKKTVTPVRSISWKRWVPAACILLAAGGSWMAWERLHNAATRPGYQDIAQALAGHSPADKIKLVTADGRAIEVDSLKQLKEKDGTIIQVQQGGMAYQNDRGNVSSAPANALLMNTLIVPRGYMYNLVLSDGSKVWLNADSKISFPVQFDKSGRAVTVEGEAYFEVAHNEKWPF